MALSSGRIRLIAKALANITSEELDQLNQLIEAEGGQPLTPTSKRTASKTSGYQPPKPKTDD